MREPLFIPAPFFFLRSPMWAMEDYDRILGQEKWVDAIFNLYETDEFLREAVAIASPSLHSALQKKNFQKIESIGISLLNYMLRMATRATPFGVFSFIATGSWGEKTKISFDLNKVRKRARPDMSWIYALIQKIYKTENPSLSVQTNPLLKLDGERVYLSYVRHERDRDADPFSQTFSIRATKLVRAVLELAKEPKEIKALLNDLPIFIPELDREKSEKVIQALFSQQFLLPSLLPSLLSLSPFEDLMPHLPNSTSMNAIAKKFEVYNQLPIGKGLAVLEELQKDMGTIASAKTFLQVDTVYKGSPLQLPKNVGEEIGLAASLLWNISSRYSSSAFLPAYHAKFIEKYGIHRTVPLLELLSEETGLGPLEKFQPVSSVKQVSNFAKQWEKWLSQKWQESLHDKNQEIVLSKKTIDHLFALANEPPPNPQEALSSIDFFCKIIADSSEQVDRGNFFVLFIQSTWQGGSSIGRFVDLLDEKTQVEFRGFFEEEELLEKNTLFIEVSYWPQMSHSANVATHPCFRKYRLDIEAKKRDAHSLSLEDIYVGATSDRLYLTLKEGRWEVISRIGHLLSPTLAPAPLQFMREVTLAKHQLLYPFFWGSLQKEAFFLPRVRFERTILFPAQWNVNVDLFDKEQAGEISSKFSSWADRWNLPRRCFLARKDRHLLIDRYHSAHLREISLKLKKGESLQFIESIGTPWIKSERGHHLCEIVVPFLKNPAYAQKKPLIPSAHFPVSINNRLKLLGSEWVSVKLYLGEEKIDRFLTQHLSLFAEKLCQEMKIAGWFFVRYRDPEWHLRFRIRLTDRESLSPVIFRLKEMSLQWIEAGLIKDITWVNYEREIERYGGPKLIEAAELVFCADSLANVHLLRAFLNKNLVLPEPILHALSAVSFLKDFNLTRINILSLLNPENAKGVQLKGFREHKSQLIALGQALEERTSLKELKAFTEASGLRKGVQEFFQTQAQSLSSDALFAIYNSMLHMHCNRLGCDPIAEKRARLYASHALRNWSAHFIPIPLP